MKADNKLKIQNTTLQLPSVSKLTAGAGKIRGEFNPTTGIYVTASAGRLLIQKEKALYTTDVYCASCQKCHDMCYTCASCQNGCTSCNSCNGGCYKKDACGTSCYGDCYYCTTDCNGCTGACTGGGYD